MKEIINAVTRDRGITEKQLAADLGIDRTTLHRWKNKPPYAIKAVSKLIDYYLKTSIFEK
jgi:DNA-binding Xre family transcriptional regulator